MQEKLITFETAKIAKEGGITEEVLRSCECFYDEEGISYKSDIYSEEIRHNAYSYKNIGYCLAPTQSLLHKWLREKHNLIIIIDILPALAGPFKYTIKSLKIDYLGKSLGLSINFYTYEQVLEKGLQEALKLIKV